jgi:hypothetical protein
MKIKFDLKKNKELIVAFFKERSFFFLFLKVNESHLKNNLYYNFNKIYSFYFFYISKKIG